MGSVLFGAWPLTDTVRGGPFRPLTQPLRGLGVLWKPLPVRQAAPRSRLLTTHSHTTALRHAGSRHGQRAVAVATRIVDDGSTGEPWQSNGMAGDGEEERGRWGAAPTMDSGRARSTRALALGQRALMCDQCRGRWKGNNVESCSRRAGRLT